MARPAKLEHVKWVRSKGREYAYFNTGQREAGKPVYVRLPDFASPSFWGSYAAMKGARERRASPTYTVAAMARDFEYSPTFKALSANTQLAYSQTLRRIAALLGKFPVDALERKQIKTVLEKEVPGAASHNLFLAVTGALYKWGRETVERTAAEPTKGIARRKDGGQHEPWPASILKAGLAADDAIVRLAVRLLYFTGQRIGDVLAMRWSDVEDGEISIVQQKTGKRVWIRLHRDLHAELATTPKRAITILSDAIGRPFSVPDMRAILQAFTIALGVKTVPHGLRKNAVIALLEVECSVAEVAAITGQTYAVVEHYAKQINKRKMAGAAIYKLENKGGS